jgi:hypothetical protein
MAGLQAATTLEPMGAGYRLALDPGWDIWGLLLPCALLGPVSKPGTGR